MGVTSGKKGKREASKKKAAILAKDKSRENVGA
jgi:hypothetical protein